MVNQPSLFETIVTGKPVKEFFNTVHLTGPELATATGQAKIQHDRVLKIFQEHQKMTPIECWKIYCTLYPAALLTSIRRSITVLTRHDKLRKLDEQKKEQYGSLNYIWEIIK